MAADSGLKIRPVRVRIPLLLPSVKENTTSNSDLPTNSEKHTNGVLRGVNYRTTERLGKECSLYIGG